MNRYAIVAHALLDGGVLGLLSKVSVLLALAALTSVAAHRASAAARHMIWTFALGGAVLLAVLTPMAPALILRVEDTASTARPSVPRFLPSAARPTSTLAARDPRLDHNSPAARASRAVDAGPATSASASVLSSIVFSARKHFGAVLLAVWALGCLVVVGRWIAGRLIVDHLAAASAAAVLRTNPAHRWDVRAFGIDRRVRVLVSHAVAAPITYGVLRPVVLLPVDANGWSDERLRAVLLHEFAHVARLDYLAQLVATIACGLFWFHPGVWLAAARLRSEGEFAADDCVLAAGMPGVSYATHLLEVARLGGARQRAAAAAVSMARTSHLEGRLRAMLDSTRSRATVPRRAQLCAGGLALFLLIPLAGVRTELIAASRRVNEEMVNRGSTSSARSGLELPRHVASNLSTSRPTVADSTVQLSVAARAGERLTLELATGGEVTIQGSDDPQVKLRAALAGANWRDTRVSLERVDGGVRLRSRIDAPNSTTATAHRFELWVPRRFDVSLSSAGGDVTIRDLSGDFRGHTGGGTITVTRASGVVAMSTGGGYVEVSESDLTGYVTSGSGDRWTNGGYGAGVGIPATAVVGEARRTATAIATGFGYEPAIAGAPGVAAAIATTGVGSGVGVGFGYGSSSASSDGVVASTVVGGVGGTVTGGIAGREARAATGYGVGRSISSATSTTTSITTNRSGEPASASVNITRASGGFGSNMATSVSSSYSGPGLHISKSGGRIDIDNAPDGGLLYTGGGGIWVGSSGGGLSASTGGGDVELLGVSGDASVSTGAGDVTVRVTDDRGGVHSVAIYSGHGRVEIELPATLDARLDIETAFTNNFGRETHIESDWTLDRPTVTDWDDHQGTARKYVRGSATIGTGRGLIRIRTLNGDVVIRRSPR